MAVPKGFKTLGSEKGGSFAIVYKVRHEELGYVRAIRELYKPITAKNDEELKRSKEYQDFLREADVLLKLGNGNHPHIENIHTFGTFPNPDLPSEHILYWERNYIQGENLDEYLKKNGHFMLVEEVIMMAEQICSALSYCHEDAYRFLMNPNEDDLPDGCVVGSVVEDDAKRKVLIDRYKVIHNDIHLKNIMRCIDGNYILIDFGKAVEGEENPTFNRSQGGAEITRAPELWNSNSSVKPNPRTDVYSFGVVLYAFLAGQYPFSNDKTLMDSHCNKWPLPSIESIRKKFYEKKFPGQTYKRDYPQWLEDAIMKCLEKDPAKRFRNGKELYEYIKGHCQDANNAKYEMEIGQLTSENETLNSQVNGLRDANVSINKQLNSTQNALAQTQQTLHDTQDQLEKLRHQFNKSRVPLWILLTLFGLWGVAASLYAWNNRPTELNMQLEQKDQAIASANDEINELKATITDLQNGESHPAPNKNESEKITRLTNLIAKKDQKIRDLETQLSNQKTSDNSAELKRLNNEVTRLNNLIKEKDKEILDLESEINDKNKRIAALEKVISGKKTNK